MNILLYAFISALLIMVWHFAFSTRPREFGLFLMVGIFLFGGVMGYVMKSIELALLISIIGSLIFI